MKSISFVAVHLQNTLKYLISPDIFTNCMKVDFKAKPSLNKSTCFFIQCTNYFVRDQFYYYESTNSSI